MASVAVCVPANIARNRRFLVCRQRNHRSDASFHRQSLQHWHERAAKIKGVCASPYSREPAELSAPTLAKRHIESSAGNRQ